MFGKKPERNIWTRLYFYFFAVMTIKVRIMGVFLF